MDDKRPAQRVESDVAVRAPRDEAAILLAGIVKYKPIIEGNPPRLSDFQIAEFKAWLQEHPKKLKTTKQGK